MQHLPAIVGTTEAIKELMGLNRYDEHCIAWRWKMYVQDDDKRFANVMAEVRRMNSSAHNHLTPQQQADILLAEHQAERRKLTAAQFDDINRRAT